MVIISASICDKQGKILISRQFQNITKHNLEENIRNFPKSISATQQHTFVENDQVRYVYLPLDNLYIVLITKKNSNIIEDQETIRLLYKIVMELCPSGVNEHNIVKNSIDIILAFDDVISYGYRESISLQQVQNALEMESSEEKLHQMLMKSRMNEAKEQAKKHQKEMEKRRYEKKKGGGGGEDKQDSFQSGFGNDTETTIQTISETNLAQSLETSQKSQPIAPTGKATNFAPKTGMQLGKKKATIQKDEIKVVGKPVKQEKTEIEQKIEDENKEPEQTVVNPLKAPCGVDVVEKLTCSLNRDGGLNSFKIVGEVILMFGDPSRSRAAVEIKHEEFKQIQIKPHPSINKQIWQQKKVIALKDQNEKFPINTKIPTIQYKFSSTDIQDCPISFTHWFNDGALTLEAEFNPSQERFKQLNNIEFYVDYPNNEYPEVKSCENGDYQVNQSSGQLKWVVEQLNEENTTCNIEVQFSSSCKADDLFPINIRLKTDYTFFKIYPNAVMNLADNSALNFECNSRIETDKFNIV